MERLYNDTFNRDETKKKKRLKGYNMVKKRIQKEGLHAHTSIRNIISRQQKNTMIVYKKEFKIKIPKA